MKTYLELLSSRSLHKELERACPNCRFCGQPLALVQGGLSLGWENSLHPEWWDGQDDAICPHQDRRPISLDDIIAAARRAGLPEDDLTHAVLSLPSEVMAQAEAATRGWNKFVLAENAKRVECQKRARERLLAAQPHLLNVELAAAAAARLEALLTTFPRAERMSRKGDLLDDRGRKLARFEDARGLCAWLVQHGFRPSLDDRQHFFNACS